MRYRAFIVGLSVASASFVGAASSAQAGTDFECTVMEESTGVVALSWTDIGRGYNIRHLIDDDDYWLESVDAAVTSTTVPTAFGTYKVIGNDGAGRVEATCDGPAGQPEPFMCATTNANEGEITWTDQGADVYIVREQIYGLDFPADRTTETQLTTFNQYSGFRILAQRNSQVVAETECDGRTPPDAFTCSVDVDARTLHWDDAPGNRHNIWVVEDGVAVRSLGWLSGGDVPMLGVVPVGDFEVRFRYQGVVISARCSGTTAEPFECSVTPRSDGLATVEWNEQYLYRYVVSHRIDGQSKVVKRTFGDQRRVVGDYLFGTMIVSGDQNGIEISTTCDGPSSQPEPFVCRVGDGVVSWTDQGARISAVRQQVSGRDVFIARTSELSVTPGNDYGSFSVSYDRYGRSFTTRCPGVPLEPFECQVEGDQLSWGDQQVGIYHLRQIVDGDDVYLGNSAETVRTIDDPRGDFEVIYRRGGKAFRTSCSA